MAYFSFAVIAKYPVGIPQPLVMLDTGYNVFNAELSDPDEIEAFKALLENEDVTIREMHRLDSHEAGSPDDLLLDGESDLLLGGPLV